METKSVEESGPVNIGLLREVLAKIAAEPEHWHQGVFAANLAMEQNQILRREVKHDICGTVMCVAGHAVNMSEGLIWNSEGEAMPASGDDWMSAGQRVLGLTQDQAVYLFKYSNTREELEQAAEQIASAAGWKL